MYSLDTMLLILLKFLLLGVHTDGIIITGIEIPTQAFFLF